MKSDQLTLEEAQRMAKYFVSAENLKSRHPKLFAQIIDNGWLDNLTFRREPREWSLAAVQQVAARCSSRNELKKLDSGAYNAAWREKWLDKLGFKEPELKPVDSWTLDEVLELAKDCRNISELRERSSGAYTAIKRNEWRRELVFTERTRAPIKSPCLQNEHDRGLSSKLVNSWLTRPLGQS